MSTGIVATAIVLIIGYVLVSRIVGLAFRLVVPLVLVVLLGGAGMVSGLMPERSAADPYASYGEAQHRPSADIGDLRLRDIADMAVDAVRSVLRGSLALLNGLSDSEPGQEPRWPEEPEHSQHRSPYGPQPDFPDDARQDDPRQDEPRPRW